MFTSKSSAAGLPVSSLFGWCWFFRSSFTLWDPSSLKLAERFSQPPKCWDVGDRGYVTTPRFDNGVKSYLTPKLQTVNSVGKLHGGLGKVAYFQSDLEVLKTLKSWDWDL